MLPVVARSGETMQQKERRAIAAAVAMKQHAPIVDAISSKKQTGFGT
jgi:hypothetical protein